jgi:hypothetical protein
MADKKKAVLLRISPELWAQLNRWAAAELRSLNAQIEYVLREAVRKRSGTAADDKAAEGVFEAAYPWLQQLIDELRQRGLADWAQRLEGAIGFAGTRAQMLANVRANLEELVEGPTVLPPEAATRAQGLLRALEEAGYGRALGGERPGPEPGGRRGVAEEKPNEPNTQA